MNIPTLFITSAIVLAALAGLMVFFASLRQAFPGFREWTLGQVAGSLGLVLLALRGRAPDLVTIFAANLAVVLHPVLMRRGFHRFYRLSMPRRLTLDVVLLAVGAGLMAWFTYFHPDVRARIVVIGTLSGLLHLGTALDPLASPEARRNRAQRAIAVVFGAVGLVHLARAARFAVVGPVTGLFVDPTLPAIVLVAVTSQVAIVCGLIYLNFERSAETLRAIERERTLRESEVRFRALIEKSTDIVYVLDADRAFQFFSPGGTAALGWAEDQILGHRGSELTHPDDEPRVAAAFQTLLAEPGSTAHGTYRLRHRDGSWRLVDSVARNHLGDPALRGIVVSARDITEQRRLQEQLLEAQKLESIGQLAGGVAHDFNNLLTAIVGGAEGVHHSLETGSPVSRDDVQDIRDAGARATDLTRQLLAFARRQPIAPTPLDLNDLTRGMERIIRRLLPESIELRVSLAPDLWPVLCDAGQLQQVVLNLAVNARDAMPGGGRLVIETANAALDGPAAAALGAAGPGEFVRLTVSDSGSGMSTEAKAHVFEPFFTTKARGRGTGLGLAAVHGIVKQSRGSIAVESQPGRGTVFHVHLPRSDRPHRREAAPAASARLPRGAERLLLVEDDPLVRAVAVRALRNAGYDVRVASDAQEALAQAGAGPGPVDLLVTDVVMPGLNGRKLAERLRAAQPGLRVLYVSGFTQDAIAEQGVLEAGVDLLEKPFTPATLVERVRRALDRPGPGHGPEELSGG